MKKEGVTNERIMGYLVGMNECLVNVEMRMVTKDDLEALRQDIREEMEPFSVALDKDAETIINHEKKITALERKPRRFHR